jgi:hypothetical protein
LISEKLKQVEKAMVEDPKQTELLPPPSRKLGTKSEYARHRQVQPSAITRAIKAGRITTVTLNGKELIDFEKSDADWVLSTRTRSDAMGPPPPRGARKAPESDDLADRMQRAKVRREEAIAWRAQGELDALRGSLLHRDEVEKALADFGRLYLSKLQSFAFRLAPAVSGHTDVQVLIEIIQAAVGNLIDDINSGIPNFEKE